MLSFDMSYLKLETQIEVNTNESWVCLPELRPISRNIGIYSFSNDFNSKGNLDH